MLRCEAGWTGVVGAVRKLEDTGHSAPVASVPEENQVNLCAADGKGATY